MVPADAESGRVPARAALYPEIRQELYATAAEVRATARVTVHRARALAATAQRLRLARRGRPKLHAPAQAV